MAATEQSASTNPAMEKDLHANGTSSADHVSGNVPAARRPYDYGGNPLAKIDTSDSARLQAFGGYLEPGEYRASKNMKVFGNPAPLGLCGFALTTFLLSLINLGSNGLTGQPSLVIGAAFGYGGLVQLLAGMWEMAVGNTFGATALSSYGGFWIGTAIILTPGGFQIETTLGDEAFGQSFGLYLIGWFIFTFILLLLTLKSTLAFFLLFLFLDLAFLMLGISYLYGVNIPLLRAGGVFGILSAFMAWYNAFAGMADRSNSFFLIPVVHFPWSDKGRERRQKVDNSAARAEQQV